MYSVHTNEDDEELGYTLNCNTDVLKRLHR